jgi:hypothetical protein
MPTAERGRGPKRARLTFLTRAYCHLCDTMRDALMPLAAAHGAKVRELDVDADPALEAAYHLDRARVVAALASP